MTNYNHTILLVLVLSALVSLSWFRFRLCLKTSSVLCQSLLMFGKYPDTKQNKTTKQGSPPNRDAEINKCSFLVENVVANFLLCQPIVSAILVLMLE